MIKCALKPFLSVKRRETRRKYQYLSELTLSHCLYAGNTPWWYWIALVCVYYFRHSFVSCVRMNFKRHVLRKEIKFPVYRYQKVIATPLKITVMFARSRSRCVLWSWKCERNWLVSAHNISIKHAPHFTRMLCRGVIIQVTWSRVWGDVSCWTFYAPALCALLSL